jgi:hypothetical protein
MVQVEAKANAGRARAMIVLIDAIILFIMFLLLCKLFGLKFS